MAKEEKGPQKAEKQNNNVAAIDVARGCKFDGCKTKPKKFGFCMEHFEMYMSGVIRGDGQKPSDYETKLSQWKQQKAKKAA